MPSKAAIAHSSIEIDQKATEAVTLANVSAPPASTSTARVALPKRAESLAITPTSFTDVAVASVVSVAR